MDTFLTLLPVVLGVTLATWHGTLLFLRIENVYKIKKIKNVFIEVNFVMAGFLCALTACVTTASKSCLFFKHILIFLF